MWYCRADMLPHLARPIGHGSSVMHVCAPHTFIQTSILSGVSPAIRSFFQSLSVYIHVRWPSSYLALTTDTSYWGMPWAFFFLSFFSSFHFRGRCGIKSEFTVDFRKPTIELYTHLCRTPPGRKCPEWIVRTWVIGIWREGIWLLRSVLGCVLAQIDQ